MFENAQGTARFPTPNQVTELNINEDDQNLMNDDDTVVRGTVTPLQ